MSVPAAPAKQPPTRGWYVLAAVLAITGATVAGLFIYHRVTTMTGRLIQVVVPGEAALPLQPGSYTIFHEYRSEVDGRVYSANSLAGLHVELRAPDGRRIALTSPSGTSRYTIAGRAGVSVFTFEAPAQGIYSLTAAYEDGARQPQTVLAIGTGFVMEILTTVAISLALIFGGIGGAVAIIIPTALARRRARLAAPPS